MTKFKIGDRVRALEDYKRQGIRRGDVRKITDFKYGHSGMFYGYQIEGGGSGHWSLRNFELVTDDIKVGDYVSIDGTDSYLGALKKGTVKSVETYATVKSDSGQDYVRKLHELTPAVKAPVDPEPAIGTMVTWPALRFVRLDRGWVKLGRNGVFDSDITRTWDELNGRGTGRHKVVFYGKRNIVTY